MKTVLLIILIINGGPAFAESAKGDSKPFGTITPYADFYYSYNFNEPFPPNPVSGATVVNATQPAGNTALHYYDQYHNQFSVALVEFSFQKTLNSTDFVADFDFGQNAEINARQTSGILRVVDESSKHIGQAFVAWRPPQIHGLLFEIGKLSTHMGIEGTKAKDNWQYSRTMMFAYGLPRWHTGLRGSYELSSIFSATAALYNGWNNFYDSNAAKTVGARLDWKACENLAVAYAFIGGAEQDNESMNQRIVHEVSAIWASEAWSFGFESIYGSEQNVAATVVGGRPKDLAIWSGWGVQARWRVSDWYEVNPRVEWYNDNHGYTLGNGEQKVWSASITEAYHFTDGIEPRVEVRYDKTSADGTFSRKGASVADQFTFTLALLYTPGSF